MFWLKKRDEKPLFGNYFQDDSCEILEHLPTIFQPSALSPFFTHGEILDAFYIAVFGKLELYGKITIPKGMPILSPDYKYSTPESGLRTEKCCI
jgi:hypothetical protein